MEEAKKWKKKTDAEQKATSVTADIEKNITEIQDKRKSCCINGGGSQKIYGTWGWKKWSEFCWNK